MIILDDPLVALVLSENQEELVKSICKREILFSKTEMK